VIISILESAKIGKIFDFAIRHGKTMEKNPVQNPNKSVFLRLVWLKAFFKANKLCVLS
jgi:hypothetical protein